MTRVKMMPHELRNLGAEAEARITAELRKPLTDRKPRAKRGEGKVGKAKRAKALGSPLTLVFETLVLRSGLVDDALALREYRFHADRQWRFDFAWPNRMVAVELDGGVWTQGRHTRGRGFEGDCEKLNAAAALGWTVLRYTMGMLKRPDPLADLRAVLEAKR